MRPQLLVAVGTVALVFSEAISSAMFMGLGRTAFEISGDGKVVNSGDSRWTEDGGWETWESYSGGAISSVNAMSYDGSVVANNSSHWPARTGLVEFGKFPASYIFNSSDISGDGSVVVGTGRISDPELSYLSEAFLWTANKGRVGLGGIESDAFGVSADGKVVLGTEISAGGSAAFWTEDDGWTTIGGIASLARASSSDGRVVIGEARLGGSYSGYGGFRWTEEGGLEFIENPFALDERWGSPAFDVSADGQVIVGRLDDASYSVDPLLSIAYIWDEEHGTRVIRDVLIAEGVDMTGWHLFSASSISADGSSIVGDGISPNGEREGWIAKIPRASTYTLKCSADSDVNGADPDCRGGTFSSGLWVYLWPEDNVDTVDFFLDGAFNNTERFVPYELDARAETVLSPGSHTVRAVANLAGGGTEEIIATFTIDDAAAYTLLCSADSVVDGNDVACDGRRFDSFTHPSGIWVYLWPEDESVIDYVDYFLNGTFERRENFVPWELLRGDPLAVPASLTNYVITTSIGLISGGEEPGPAAVFSFGP